MLLHFLFMLLPAVGQAVDDKPCLDYYPKTNMANESAVCPQTHIIDIRGTTELQGPSAQRCIIFELISRLPQTHACALNYPAGGLDPNNPRNPVDRSAYAKSEDKGVDQLSRHLMEYKKECPKSNIVLMGYSQGAHVIGDSLCGRVRTGRYLKERPALDPKYFENVKAIIQFGDPSNLKSANLPWHRGSARGPGIFHLSRKLDRCRYIGDKGIWRSYCDKHDLFCDFFAPPLNKCPHLEYLRYAGDEVLRFIMEKITKKEPPPEVQTKCGCPPPERHCTDCKNKTSTPLFELKNGNFEL